MGVEQGDFDEVYMIRDQDQTGRWWERWLVGCRLPRHTTREICFRVALTTEAAILMRASRFPYFPDGKRFEAGEVKF